MLVNWGGEMRKLEKVDHLTGSVARSRIGLAEQTRQHRAPMLLSGEDEIVAHGQLGKDLQQLKRPADAQAIEVSAAKKKCPFLGQPD